MHVKIEDEAETSNLIPSKGSRKPNTRRMKFRQERSFNRLAHRMTTSQVAKLLEAAANPANSHVLNVDRLEAKDLHHVLQRQQSICDGIKKV